MKSLKTVLEEAGIWTNIAPQTDEPPTQDPIPGGIDIALAGEIKYDMVWTADYICKTPIFKMYVDDLIKFYTEDIDPECKLNLSTYDELSRQLADDIILLSKNTQIK